jgi:DNA-binding ferritin-like protein
MLSYFSKERSQARKLTKCQKKLLNLYSQSVERQHAAHQLAEIGTPEAFEILLSRFEKNVPNSTIDRTEKVALHQMLTDLGDQITEPIIKHIRGSAENINWPLKVLRAFKSNEFIADFIAEMLSEMDTDYSRNPVKKEELVITSQELVDDKLGEALLVFLDDANERIRFLAVEAILKGQNHFASSSLVSRLTGEEESLRVVTRIVEGLADTDWTVKGHRAAVEGNIPDGYIITRSGTIRRRG